MPPSQGGYVGSTPAQAITTNVLGENFMPNKKYDFIKLLKEYNKKFGHDHKLHSKISKATVSYSASNGGFTVIYTYDDSNHRYSLYDFIYYNVSSCPDISTLKSFILSKEEPTLNLRIETLPPNKIRYAYLYSNYFAPGAGTLGRSCMRHKVSQKSLNFYIKNNVKIVVLIGNNHKIHARALLWDNVKSTKLKNSFTYLDRVYARSDSLISQFYYLAKENGWKRYDGTSPGNAAGGLYKDNLDITGMCHMPWVDTFKYLYYKDGLAASSGRIDCVKHSNHYVSLTHTDGMIGGVYIPDLDPNKIREAISGNYISKKNAVFIKRYDGYVLKKNIADINGDYYSVYDEIVTSTKLDGYILKENSVQEVITQGKIDKTIAIQSVRYKGHVHKSNAVCIKNTWPNGDDEIYHKQDVDVVCFDNKWYHISQCFINYDRKKVNEELAKQPIFSYADLSETWIPYATVERKGNLIPKERAIIAYDLVYNPMLDDIEYQVVYCTDTKKLTQLNTGEFIVNSSNNRKYLKKFNNKYHIRQDFKLSSKKQLTFDFGCVK